MRFITQRSFTSDLSREGYIDLAIAAFLIVLICLFLYPAVFQGKFLAPLDFLCQDPIWLQRCKQVGVTSVHNGEIGGDQASQFYHWHVLTRNLWKSGSIPLWNPYNYGGHPFLANSQSAVFYPLNLITLPLTLKTAYTVSAIVRLFVAGWFTYLFSRGIKVSRLGALFAAIAFTFSGPMVVWLGYPHSNVIVWIPALFYLTEKFLKETNFKYVLGLGCVFALQGLGGHPETLFHVGVGWGLYVLLRFLVDFQTGKVVPKGIYFYFGGLTTAVILGIFLSAIQILPTLDALQRSYAFYLRHQSTQNIPILGRAAFRDYLNLMLFIWPNFFGNPANGQSAYRATYQHYVETAAYIGVLPLLFSSLSVLHEKAKHFALTLVFTAIITLGIAFRFPIFDLANNLPGVSLAANARLRLVVAFFLAILGGVGLDALERLLFGNRKRRFILFLVGIVLLMVIALALKERLLRLANIVPQITLPTLSLADDLVPVAIMIVFILAIKLFRLPESRHVEGTALLLTIFNLFWAGLRFNSFADPRLDISRFRADFETVSALEAKVQGFERVASNGTIMLPNSASAIQMFNLQGYDPMVFYRYYEFFKKFSYIDLYGPGGFRFRYVKAEDVADREIGAIVKPLRLLAVKHYLLQTKTEKIKVVEDPDALPRAFLVQRVEKLPADQVLATLWSPDFRPGHQAIVEEDLPIEWASSTSSSIVEGPPIPADIVSYSPNEVFFYVSSLENAFLVFSDTFDPGWKVFVDGIEGKVYLTNYIMRGVFIPAGSHEVRFVYRPLSFIIGASVTGFTALAIIIWIIMRSLVSNPSKKRGA